MSGNGGDDKLDHGKSFPLDLAAKFTTVKTVECKAPLVVAGQPLRSMRLLTQPVPVSSVQTTVTTPTILAANILPQAVIKQAEANRSQVTNLITTTQTQPQGTGNITIQRPAQITLSATLPVVAQTPTGTYHVPRGPAVVANLAAPRSNVATAIRTPTVVTAQNAAQQSQTFVRPPRTPSPAQGTAWLTTNSSNGSQIKGAPTVLSSPVRGASVTAAPPKPQFVARSQPLIQNVSSIRPTSGILHSAITIGQGGQIHSFKANQTTTGIQTLGNTVTLAQVLPTRTQTLVYSTGGSNTHFPSTATPRLTVASGAPSSRQNTTPKTVGQVATARITMPVSVSQTQTARLVAPQGAVITTGTRISSVSNPQQPAMIGTTPTRIVSATQPTVALGRLSVSVSNPAQTNNANVLGQTRISAVSLHPLVAVANSSQARTLQTQGAKVITQPAQVGVQPSAIVTQRSSTTAATQAIPLAKVFPQQSDSQQTTPTANVFIASVPRRTSPGPANITPTTTVPTTTVATYSIASGTYFYDTSGTYSVARAFNQQSSFAAVPQSNTQPIRPTTITTQVHGIVANQQMRFNPVMVVEQNRTTQFSHQQQDISQESAQMVAAPTKLTSSPRPSILRKRDHEGSPLKAAKNLAPVLSGLPPQPQPPISPPSRPDSGGNGHSSGGSTTISATSSPGLAETNEDSMPHAPVTIKEEEESHPPPEMSPRKKPRKQQFRTGNDIDEHMHEDMQFISETSIKKEPDSDGNHSDSARDECIEPQRIVKKPVTASLLNSYRQTWKATHNHYLRYSDVRPKDEKRPTIMDLSNQYRVLDKVNGWKIHHLSTQMEDLADQEQTVHKQLTELLKYTEAEEGNDFDKDVNRINELIKGNLQRIKIINDGMIEAKNQIMKIFDHKMHVTDIISRCASKRNFKKREKS